MTEFSPPIDRCQAAAPHRPEQTGHLPSESSDSAAFGNTTTGRDDVDYMALDEADSNLTKLGEPQELRVLINLSYSLQMLRRLPWYACDDLMPELPTVVRQASRDAFFTHTRLVAEFFCLPVSTDDDARLFLPSWTPPDEVARRLEARWTQAMMFVAPFTRDSDPTPLVAPSDIDLSALALEQIVFDCDATVERFVEACEAGQVELLPEIRTLLDSAAG